jgi:multiple sugar transport system substrate-binding protein
MSEFSRRHFLAAAAGLGLSVAPAWRVGAEDKRLRMFWWGSKERADRTYRASDLYMAKTPSTRIDGETIGWNDYWTRVATQAAGRNLADVVQMDYRYLFEYARRGALLPLDSFVYDTLDIADFGKDSIDCGRVDGKLYGVNLGNNSTAMIVNGGAFEAAGLGAPKTGLSWQAFGDLCADLTKAVGKEGFFGSGDAGGNEQAFEAWLRQRGKELYDADGKVAFDGQDAAEWFGFWDDLRKRRACVPANVQALDKLNIETNALTLGKAAIGFANSNQLVGFQALNQNPLSLAMFPAGGPGSQPGQYLKPAMMFSVAATSKNPEEAAKVINFLVKDPQGVAALGVERGIPPSAAARKLVAGDLDDLGKAMVTYIDAIADKVGPLPPPPPKGAGEIQFLLKRVNEEVGFAKASAVDAGQRFHIEAVAIIARG